MHQVAEGWEAMDLKYIYTVVVVYIYTVVSYFDTFYFGTNYNFFKNIYYLINLW